MIAVNRGKELLVNSYSARIIYSIKDVVIESVQQFIQKATCNRSEVGRMKLPTYIIVCIS